MATDLCEHQTAPATCWACLKAENERLKTAENELNELHSYLDAIGVPKHTNDDDTPRPDEDDAERPSWLTRDHASNRVAVLQAEVKQARDENDRLHSRLLLVHGDEL